MTIKGSLHSGVSVVSDFSIFGRKFCPSFRQKSTFGGPKQGLNATFNFCNPKKVHPFVISHLLGYHASKSVEGSVGCSPKKDICMYVCI